MTTLIAITGGSGAGKTTIAHALARRIGAGARLVAEDDYYRCATSYANFDPETHNFDEPAAKDEALLSAHLAAARAGQAFDKPLYDLTTHKRRAETERVAPTEALIFEGIHLLAFPSLLPLFDLKVYVEADESVRLGRRMIRDVESRGRTARSVFNQFLSNVRPMHDLHVTPQRARADLVLLSEPHHGLAEADALAADIHATLTRTAL